MQPPLASEYLEFAERWLSSCGPHINWVLGEPGSGKSTLLEACGLLRPSWKVIELSRLLSHATSFAIGDRGLTRLASLAASLRTPALECPSPTVVVACSLPASFFTEPRTEPVFVLTQSLGATATQLLHRPPRKRAAANETEIAYHREVLAVIATMPAVRTLRPPYSRSLVGRLSTLDA
jgi:hypothetical protein